MRTCIILILTVINLSCMGISKTCKTPLPIDTVKTYLIQLNLAQFANKPIDSLLAKIPQNYTSLKVSGSSRIDIASLLIVSYANGVSIFIRVSDFTHFDPRNPNKLPPEQVWPLAQMKKELIYSIKVFDGMDVINFFNE